MDEHPGGKFSLKANVGRDISKYFHGGYSLENLGDNKVPNHTHSMDARRIVEKYAIAKFDNVPSKLMKIDRGESKDISTTARTMMLYPNLG